MPGFQLVEAFVQMSARGQAKVLGALGTVQQRVDQFNAQNKQLSFLTDYAQQRGLKLAGDDALRLLDVLSKGGGSNALDAFIGQQKGDPFHQLGASLEEAAKKQEKLKPVLDYAKQRGLNVAAEDAGKLAAKLDKLGDLKAFDKWIEGQVKARKNMEEMAAGFAKFQQAATVGFATLTGSIAGFVQQASPAHWQTLTGSIGLLAGSIGEAFLPAIEAAIDFIQDLDEWVRSLGPDTKKNIATWVMWGAAVLGAAVIIPRVIGFLTLMAQGLYGVGKAAFVAGRAIVAFAMANPATAILAIVAAVAALGIAFNQVGEAVENASARLDQFQEASEQLERGSPATRRQIDLAFEGRAGELGQARQAAPGSAEFRQRWQAIRDQARQEATEQNAEQREQMSLRARAVLERPFSLSAERQREGPANVQGADFFRRRQLLEAGVSPQLVQQLQQQNALSGSTFGGQLTTQQIQNITDFIRGRGGQARLRQQIAEQALTSGQQPDGGRRRLTAGHFQSSLGGVEDAWRQLQLAAAGGSSLEAERDRRWADRWRDLMQRLPLPSGAGNQPSPPQPPGGGGEF